MKIGIIGAGISGLALANLLNSQYSVTVFEKEMKPGGLIKCIRINDCLFHTVGGHVFNAKDKEVNKWFWSNFDKEKEFIQAKRNAKILINNSIIGYPIENFLFQLDANTVKKVTIELLELNTYQERTEKIKNFETFLKASFGETLYKLYFKPYNEKLWNTQLNEIPLDWLDGKLPMPNITEIIVNNILKQEENDMVHSHFFYPKENGSQFIINRLKTNILLKSERNIEKIEIKGNKISIEDEYFDKVVFCGDVRQISSMLTPSSICSAYDFTAINQLKSNATSNIFCETDDTDISWLYIPGDFTSAHRIIYTGNFSTTNNRGSLRKTCVVEFSGKVPLNVMKEEIKKLPGNLTALGYNYQPHSYVIQNAETRNEINRLKKFLREYNVYLLGRFAEWEYYNMDTAIKAAFNLSNLVFN